MQTKSSVIKVTGVPEELLHLLDERVKTRHYAGRSEYIRELIRRDATAQEPVLSIREIMAPVHAETQNMTQEELDELTDSAIREAREARRQLGR